MQELWAHQKSAVERAKNRSSYAFLFEPGLGKTRTTIEVLRHRYNSAGRILKTLIVAPVITLENWKREFLEFSKIPADKIVVLSGSGAERKHRMAVELFGEDEQKIVITNYECLTAIKGAKDMLVKWGAEIVVADEMHYLKTHNAGRSKAMREVSAKAAVRLGLTGTAILNSPMDIFGQWLFLDRGRTFGENFFVFRNRYFEDKNARMPKHLHFPKWEARASTIDVIRSKLQESASTAIKSECLDLPPLIKQRIEVPLSKEQAAHYKSLKNDFLTWVSQSGTEVVATTALVRLLRLMQVVTGYLQTEGGISVGIQDNPREKALEELLESLLPNKVIIWAVFKQNYEVVRRVCARLKIRMVECHGGVSNQQKFEAVEQFEHDSEVKVFLGHPRSLGIGINLIAAKYMIYYSRDFNLGNDIQSEARNYRAGSEIHDSITRYDLVAPGTVDELCLEALAAKAEIGDKLVKGWVELL